MTMKNNTFIKIFSFILCLTMLFGISSLVVSAEDEEYVAVEWELDPNLEYVYGGEKRYERYHARGAFYGDATKAFYFMNPAIYDGKECQVYGESADPHIVSIKIGPNYSYIFVDEEGKKILDSFLDGTDCIYYLEDYGKTYTKISNAMVEYLDEAYETKSFSRISVVLLGESQIFEITSHDKTELKARQHGAVYIMDGEYYYVCFENLDNSYFNADGYFSYRSGIVSAYLLDSNIRSSIDKSIANMDIRTHNAIYESDVVYGFYDVDGNPIYDENYDDKSNELGSIIVFFITVALFGIAVPTVLLVLSLLWARARKTGKSKCWYAVSSAAALWILSAVIFLLLVII